MNAKIWHSIIKSIIMNRKISISYRKPQHEETVERKLCPYYLLTNNSMWYILSYNESRSRIETYAVQRIGEIEILSEDFKIPLSFKIEDHIDKSWGIYSTEKKYDVEIEFNQSLSSRIKEKVWPQDYKIVDAPGGGVILKFRTNQLENIRFWLLSWGGGVKVIKPLELKNRIIEVIEEMIGIYSS
ncbi:MAG: WYL domain-containing protein [Spirochaetota bacterium]|nr:WYL domain-containing protein [Spirochaetota bacterium]